MAAIKVNPSAKEDVRRKTPDAPCNKPQIILDRFLISNNLFLLLYIWYELRCILPPSVAWGGELLAKMPTALAQNRISLPSLSGIYCTQPRTTEAGNGPKPPRNGSATFHSSTSEVNPCLLPYTPYGILTWLFFCKLLAAANLRDICPESSALLRV